MKEILADPKLVAACGLYCGACRSHLKGSCPGCRENQKAGWCDVRKCCLEGSMQSCADCKSFADVRACKKHNNFVSRVIGFVLRSDRARCIDAIKAQGYEAFAREMAARRKPSLPR